MVNVPKPCPPLRNDIGIAMLSFALAAVVLYTLTAAVVVGQFVCEFVMPRILTYPDYKFATIVHKVMANDRHILARKYGDR